MTITIRADDPSGRHVADLLAYHIVDLARLMGEHAHALDAGGLSAPGVRFFTAWEGETLAGFGALAPLGDDHGELKSMRAAPAMRGRGVGRALLDHLIADARRHGYRRLSLETGTTPMHAPAVALYAKAGFVDCAPYADYAATPHNRFMTLALPAPAAE